MRMSKTKVLVVEDEGIVARDIQQRLEAMGYKVVGPVSTGKEALRHAAESSPDLVLMDIVLKGEMTGIEAARKMMESYDVPVVYLTAHTDEGTVQQAKTTSPYGYVVKPFDDRQLQTVMEMATYRHGAEKVLQESEERFRRLAEASFEGIVVHEKGLALDMNDRLARMLGYYPEELIGTNILALVTPESRQLVEKSIRSGAEGPYEIVLMRKDGSTFTAEMMGRSIPFLGHTARVAAVRDITLRKQMEQLIRERARSELYGFVVSALPLIAPGPHQEVRTDLLRIFAERFEGYFKPRFDTEGKRPKGEKAPGREHAIDEYVRWSSELFSNFGITVSSRSKGERRQLELHNCPWIEYARNNPVFCLLCRTMASRSFSWASPGGAVGLSATIAGGRDRCVLDFRPGNEK